MPVLSILTAGLLLLCVARPAAAHLHGTFNGRLTTPGSSDNWFDPNKGNVPNNRGYLNQVSPDNITVSHNETEWGASDGLFTVELDFHHDGHTVLTMKRDPAGAGAVLSGFAPYTINIQGDTFKKYTTIKQHDFNMSIKPVASFDGDTLTITTSANEALPAPAVYIAEWHLYHNCLPGSGPCCSTTGSYLNSSNKCANATAGSCDADAFCSGTSETCPKVTAQDGTECDWKPTGGSYLAHQDDSPLTYTKADAETAATITNGRGVACQGKCQKGRCSVRLAYSTCCFTQRAELESYTHDKANESSYDDTSMSHKHKKHYRERDYGDADDSDKEWHCWK